MSKLLRVVNCGSRLVRYSDGLAAQESLAELCKAGTVPDTVLLLQHAPVFTIGKRGRQQDFKVPQEELARRGFDITVVPRGGEVTFHGPGQLVAYPVVQLKRLGVGARLFVEGLEDTVISTVGRYGISARGRVPGATGVWVGERKIAAIGVRISSGVSTHGLALNVHTDLSNFDLIVPCGIQDKEVTSIHRELSGQQPPLGQHAISSSSSSSGSGSSSGAPSTQPAIASAGFSLDLSSQPPAGCPGFDQVARALTDELARVFGYQEVQLEQAGQAAFEALLAGRQQPQ